MTSPPFFSVIIPTYNRAHLILEALRSVDSQTCRDFETIIVDDGSTDDTVQVIQSSGFDCQLVRMENGGPGAARNYGASIATGRYLAFLDSDDCFLPWTLEVYRSVIELNQFPAFVLGKPKVEHSRSDGADVQEPGEIIIERFKDYLDSSAKWTWFGVTSFVIQRDSFDEIGGFDAANINGEDADLALRLGTCAGFIRVVEPIMFLYLRHTSNVTLSTEKTFAGALRLIEREREGKYPGSLQRRRERSRIIGRHIRPVIFSALKEGRRKLAWTMYAACLRVHLRDGRWRFIIGFPLVALRPSLLRSDDRAT